MASCTCTRIQSPLRAFCGTLSLIIITMLPLLALA